ncbi:DnaJ C-terminal domain-containing protein [Synechococcus sp. UW179A]|uniref:DnaJ C-terminal domain-containing protein n=1 Tax=Synechococcus sp. UW179A TaxID=2575510 RepID=UPI000E0F2CF5|nr:DnaJ C-terminal domain-containing protein [Synechococcus sp. UW179A]
MAGSGYRDYFKVLGVERSADADAIKRAFRKLARQYHPDVNPGDTMAEAKFKEVSEAYEVLSDPDKRRRYEQFGQYWNQAGASGSGPGAAGFDVDFGRYGNFDDFINDLLGRFGGPGNGGFGGAPGGFAGGGFPGGGFPGGGFAGGGFPRGASRTPLNLDAEASVKVNFAEAFRGAERTLSVNDERVQVRIPAGVKTGSRLRLKGKGNLQPGTGRRGDLYLNLEVQPHPVWRLDGDQLRAELPVSIDELALGGNVKVMTPDGEAEVSIPAGTSPGRSLRLKGKGWPLKTGRGDLLLNLSVQWPTQWSDEQRKLLEKLREARTDDPRSDWLKSARL